ncbi:uncharacterized protein H6S33_000348 [Morchella sextelata]|uniref:uncharacterized protein n=1 Tax=Morchella sextelata TaxID=1174677 RepID=UPI001D0450B7|nr:uncharacterized protein H6S33_000348 [Morchella sextelata]KAH0614712.1 hypothetical protein H6S33_000348 [Morchella sextelata]
MASKNVEKTRARLEKRIEEGAYYEAHQQLRVVSQRYVKAKDYSAAIEILSSGAQALLKAGQGSSGCDLCLLMIEVFKTSNSSPTAELKAQVMQLIALINPEEPGRKRVINETIAWTSKHGEFPAGDPELHHFIGHLFAKEDNVYDAEKHLIVGTRDSAPVLTDLLYAWYSEDEPHTAPQYIARAVFPYLLIGNLRDASRCLQLFTAQLVEHNSGGLVVQEVQSATSDFRVFPAMPLLNFLGLLLLAIQSGGADVFRGLKSHYAGALKEAQGWDEILEQIGEIYFGIQIRRSSNLFDMMGNLFGGNPAAAAPARQIGGAAAGNAAPADLD